MDLCCEKDLRRVSAQVVAQLAGEMRAVMQVSHECYSAAVQGRREDDEVQEPHDPCRGHRIHRRMVEDGFESSRSCARIV